MPSSGIGGPCDHCGRTQSCCWRRGPASKPILCNACGSRYLVKKNLDGYIPIQQRAATVSKPHPLPKPARSRSKTPSLTLTATLKPKRVASKRLDTATWYHDTIDDSEDSEALAYIAEELEPPLEMGQVGEVDEHIGENRKRASSLLVDAPRPTKVLHITSSAQIRQLKGLSSEDVARLLEPSMRSKPRKPVHPRISVVF